MHQTDFLFFFFFLDHIVFCKEGRREKLNLEESKSHVVKKELCEVTLDWETLTYRNEKNRPDSNWTNKQS